jgi:hypothetical protein
MPQRASVFCNFYIRVDRKALVSERALDVGSVAFKAMSTKNEFKQIFWDTLTSQVINEKSGSHQESEWKVLGTWAPTP